MPTRDGCDPSVWQRALAAPASSATLPPPRPSLTAPQKATYAAVLAHFSAPSFALPADLKTWKAWRTAKKPSQADAFQPLGDVEKCFLSEETVLRFCRSMKWDARATISRAEETLVWRREYGVDDLEAEEVEEESRTGKQFVLGYDNQCRPCLHMYPYRQNTKVSPRQIRFVVWCLERTIDLMPAGIDSICLMIDFGGPGVKGAGGQPTTLGQAKQVLTILQTYYGERLARAICVHVHWLFWGFYKVVSPFIDPMTKEKLRFNPSEAEINTLLPPEQREKRSFGGDLDFVYDHETYYPTLVQLAKERRAAMLARWFQYGNGQVGMSERILRGEHPDTIIPILDAPSAASCAASYIKTDSYTETVPRALAGGPESVHEVMLQEKEQARSLPLTELMDDSEFSPRRTPELGPDDESTSDDGATSATTTTTHIYEHVTAELVQEGQGNMEDSKLSAVGRGHPQTHIVTIS